MTDSGGGGRSRAMHRPSPTLGLVLGAAIGAWSAFWVPGVHIVDGDTFDHGFWRFRPLGYDAPEIGSHAHCDAEEAAGEAAKARLAELLARGDWRLVHGGKRDRDRRILTRLMVVLPEAGKKRERDVAEIAVAEGWGRPMPAGQKHRVPYPCPPESP